MDENQEHNFPIHQCSDIIQPDTPFSIESKGHIRIEQLSILSDDESLNGSRVTVMAHVLANTSDRRQIAMDVAISSFIIGRDYDQPMNLVISPTDKCTLTIVETQVPIQILYSCFTG
ncbi:hypothetical protein TRFO_33503 [Tritrichomonas foetus]|uniref:Nucleoplasmin-like domain-containing protein n=1 Tax=Tritrichomonas foetus TaxID=1144522 RepID=A0A1J4JLL9_9EUKA|nr:hypothetical protein TRFO_33503 [Tritrichomonas foetus]|eukprot:OHS99978.1 hypothetical protein TRFO_33503 [Tritrichomonas foetus]